MTRHGLSCPNAVAHTVRRQGPHALIAPKAHHGCVQCDKTLVAAPEKLPLRRVSDPVSMIADAASRRRPNTPKHKSP